MAGKFVDIVNGENPKSDNTPLFLKLPYVAANAHQSVLFKHLMREGIERYPFNFKYKRVTSRSKNGGKNTALGR